MAKQPEAQIKISVFNQDFNKSMKEMRDESGKLNQEFKLQQEQMKNTASETEKLGSKMEFLQKKQELARKKVEETEKQYEAVKEQYGENSKAAEDMAKKLNSAKIEEQQLANQIYDTNKALEAQKEKAKEVGEKFQEVGDKISGVGKGMSVGVTAPILAVGAAGLAAFGEVDEALDTIITKTGATGEAVDGFEESFRNVATRVPFDLQSVGEAIGEVNTQFGFLGEELENNSQLVLEFSAINGQDVTSTSIQAKQAIEAYKLEHSDLEYVLDGVTKAAQDTGQSTQSLFDKATKGAPQIKALGLSFVEGVALLGNFEKSGVDSATALSYLSRAQVTFAKDGKTLQKGLEDTIKKIKGAKTETEAMNVAAKVFGTKGATRMVDAIQRGTFAIEDFAAAGEGIEGTVYNTFEATLDPIDQAAIASNNVKIALADIGNAVQVALLPFMEKATDVIRNLANWFSNLSPAIQQIIVVIAGIAAAIGPVLVVVGTLVSSIGKIMLAVSEAGGIMKILTGVMTKLGTAFTFLTGPVGLIIVAVAALIAIFVALYKNNEQFRNKVQEIWASIQAAFQVALTFIAGIVRSVMTAVMDLFGSVLSSVRGFWAENGQQIFSIVKSVFQGQVWSTIKMVLGLIKGLFEIVWPIVSGIVKVAWAIISTSIKNSVDLILGIIQFFLKIFKGDWQGAFNTIKETASKIMRNILDTFKKIDLLQIVKDIVRGLIKGISSMAGAVKDKVMEMAGSIPSWAKKVLRIQSPSVEMIDVGEDAGEGAIVGVENKIKKAKKAAVELANALIPNHQESAAAAFRQTDLQMSAYYDKLAANDNNLNNQVDVSVQPQPINLDGRAIAEVIYKHVSKLINDDLKVRRV